MAWSMSTLADPSDGHVRFDELSTSGIDLDEATMSAILRRTLLVSDTVGLNLMRSSEVDFADSPKRLRDSPTFVYMRE